MTEAEDKIRVWAYRYARELRPTDKRFKGDVSLELKEGSKFFFRKAFILQVDTCWLVTITRSFGNWVFHENDLTGYQYHVTAKKLPDRKVLAKDPKVPPR